jgi:hypothetical protein
VLEDAGEARLKESIRFRQVLTCVSIDDGGPVGFFGEDQRGLLGADVWTAFVAVRGVADQGLRHVPQVALGGGDHFDLAFYEVFAWDLPEVLVGTHYDRVLVFARGRVDAEDIVGFEPGVGQRRVVVDGVLLDDAEELAAKLDLRRSAETVCSKMRMAPASSAQTVSTPGSNSTEPCEAEAAR